jgi:hypothetical protein
MSVRSLSSRVLKWPDAETVHRAVSDWATQVAAVRTDVVRIGYIGSYARGDWGVGSDLDLVVVVEADERPFIVRAAAWDVANLPIPTELLAYTRAEWETLLGQGSRFSPVLNSEAAWVHTADGAE